MTKEKNEKRKKNKRIRIFALVLLQILVFLFGYLAGSHCGKMKHQEADVPNGNNKNPQEIAQNSDATEEEIVEAIMKDMSLSDMVYQMMFVTPESITNIGTAVQAGETTKKALEQYPVGGIIYFSKNLENREQTIEMIQNTQSYSRIPLFIGVDEEGGRVARLGKNPQMGTTALPPMKEIGDSGDEQKAFEVGETMANDLKELGFNVDFAPDADVLIHSKNTEIGDRSFGSDPENVAKMVENVVTGMQQNGVSATLKHFPGHGSTYVDSHTGYSQSTRTMEELRSAEFVPFSAGIEAGADFIMVSHMTLVNATEEKVPCSISKEIITDVLIEELEYEGIIITDSFSMGAITEHYTSGKAAVKAVNAGVDMILMSQDFKAAHDAIVDAVESGEISEERIQESVRKILLLKVRKGMIQ